MMTPVLIPPKTPNKNPRGICRYNRGGPENSRAIYAYWPRPRGCGRSPAYRPAGLLSYNDGMKTTTDTLLETLPDYIGCRGCGTKYFLTINRTTKGTWSASYMEFGEGNCVAVLNNCEDLEEMVARMQAKVGRFLKRSGGCTC